MVNHRRKNVVILIDLSMPVIFFFFLGGGGGGGGVGESKEGIQEEFNLKTCSIYMDDNVGLASFK
jgi:hypothetical protein